MENKLEFIINEIATTIIKNEQYLSDLDGVVGDGDFGFSLARGFEKVQNNWDDIDHSTLGNSLKGIALLIMGSVGGVSGTLWGTAFLKASSDFGSKENVSYKDVISALRSAINGIKLRGKSDLGDKTLLDALIPAVDELEKEFLSNKTIAEALVATAIVAREKAEDTRSMIAKRGRASYTGERSIGTLDTGAIAIALIFESLSIAWKKHFVNK